MGEHPAGLPSLSFLAMRYEEVVSRWEQDKSERSRAETIEELQWLAEQTFRVTGRMRVGR